MSPIGRCRPSAPASPACREGAEPPLDEVYKAADNALYEAKRARGSEPKACSVATIDLDGSGVGDGEMKFLPGSWKRPGRFGRSGVGPIGLDFEPDRLHLTQLEARGESFRLLDARSVTHDIELDSLLESKSELRRLVVDPIRRGAFRGRRIVTEGPFP